MSQIFLSHSSVDEREAIALHRWLHDNGWDDVFLDLDPERGLKAGERWQAALKRAADSCEAVVFLISPAWAGSKWCFAEFVQAKSLHKHIFGVIIKDTKLDELPHEMTAEWQLCSLIGEGSTEPICFSYHDSPAETRFLSAGLKRLRTGLKNAGLSASFFPWPPPDDAFRAPYRGLEPLEAKDAAVFFGRDAEILQGLDKLRGMRSAENEKLFVILAASSAGKSSFLRAGLLPRLARDERHFYPLEIIRPERSPLFGERALARAISLANERLGLLPVNVGDVKTALREGTARFRQLLDNIQNKAREQLLDLPSDAQPPTLVLPIDQAEELFNSDATAESRMFLDLIGNVLRANLPDENKHLSLIVAFTIRSDRYKPLQTAPELMELKSVVFDGLKPMPLGQFKEVITGPAIRSTQSGRRLEIKPDLVQQLLEDCRQGGDTLPLLSLTLSRLYRDYGKDGDLTLREYQSMGGLDNVIRTEIESILATDTDEREAQCEALHNAFIPWLATINPDNDQPIRRMARMSDLPLASHMLVQALIEKHLLLSDMREGEQVVEIAHDSLLRQWEPLAEWLVKEGDDLKEADRLKQAVAAWKESGRLPAWLMEGEHLTKAETLAAKPAFCTRLNFAEDFLKASRQREIRRKEEEERHRRAELIAAQEKQKAAEEKQAAAEAFAAKSFAGELVATAENLSKDHPDQSLLLGLAARRISAIPKADAFLRYAKANYNYRKVLRGHESHVNNAQFSPHDGKTVVTAGNDGKARLWDVATGAELRVLNKHKGCVNRAQFSPCGTMIVTAGDDGTARLWDVATGTELGVLNKHKGCVNSAEFSPCGTMVVTAGDDGAARLWDVASGMELRVLSKHKGCVNSAQFSPHDGKTVVTAGNDGKARLWDVASGEQLYVLRGHKGQVVDAQFSSDGERVVTASSDKTARVWNAASGEKLAVLPGGEDQVVSAQFSPDRKLVVTASSSLFDPRHNTASLWDTASGKELQVLRGHEEGIVSAKFSPDGKMVVTASYDKTARVWDVSSGDELQVLRGHESDLVSVEFSPDGKTVATSSKDNTVRLWAVSVKTLDNHGAPVIKVRFSSDSRMLVTASLDGTARLWDPTNAQELHVLGKSEEQQFTDAQFSHDGSVVVTASEDVFSKTNAAQLWDTATGEKSSTPPFPHDNRVVSARFSPGDKVVVTASYDMTARLWDSLSGTRLHVLQHEDSVVSAEFSDDGKRVVTASYDMTARLWDTASGKQLHILRHGKKLNSARFSPCGKMLVTAGDDGAVQLWDAVSGQPLNVFRGHDKEVLSAQFSPDDKNKIIVTASADTTARLWDATSGRELQVLRGHKGAVCHADFSADGRLVTTASEDWTARVWDAATGKELLILHHKDRVSSVQFSPNNRTVATASYDWKVRLWHCDLCQPLEEIEAELKETVGRELTDEERRRFGLALVEQKGSFPQFPLPVVTQSPYEP